jgi:hypothetical protein
VSAPALSAACGAIVIPTAKSRATTSVPQLEKKIYLLKDQQAEPRMR